MQPPDKLEAAIITTSVENLPLASQAPHEFLQAVHVQNFEFKVKTIQKSSVIFTEEAFKPYREITNICLEAKDRPIILTQDLLPMHLDDWERVQVENIEEVCPVTDYILLHDSNSN